MHDVLEIPESFFILLFCIREKKKDSGAHATQILWESSIRR